MNLLIDTHVAIWALINSNRLPTKIAQILTDPGNVVHISPVSVWEISLKHRLARSSSPPFCGREALRLLELIGCRGFPLGQHMPPLLMTCRLCTTIRSTAFWLLRR